MFSTVTWINVVILLAIMVAMSFSKRQVLNKWLQVYFVYSLVSFVFFAFFAQNSYSVYAGIRFISYLLMLGAVEELLRTKFGKKTIWAYGVLAFIAIPALFFPANWIYYYIPRIPLFGTIAFYLPLALRKKHLILIALGAHSVWNLVSDFLKLFKVDELIIKIQQLMDPWFMTVFYLMVLGTLVYAIIRDHIISQAVIKSLKSQKKVVPFPGTGLGAEAITMQEVERLVDSRFSDMEALMMAAAKSAEIFNKELLNVTDLMALIGGTELAVEAFLAKHKIEKIITSETSWVARKADVFKALGLG